MDFGARKYKKLKWKKPGMQKLFHFVADMISETIKRWLWIMLQIKSIDERELEEWYLKKYLGSVDSHTLKPLYIQLLGVIVLV